MNNRNQLKQAITNMNEDEAKTLLSLLLTYAEDSSEEDLTRTIQEVKKSLIQNKSQSSTQTIHIVFGGATAGSLRAAFRKSQYEKTEKVLEVPGVLAVGPIEALHTKEGIEKRFQWLKKHFRDDFNDIEEEKNGFIQAIEKILGIGPSQQVIIWTGENAAEQTGLRIVLHLLQDKINEVFELNTFGAFHDLHTYPALEEEPFPHMSGELTPTDLLQCYERYDLRPMKGAKRQILSNEGKNLLFNKSLLRSWEHGEILHSNIDRDDHFIVECAKKLHEERGSNDFINVVRLIGEVISHMEQYSGDGWIEYRIRELIPRGIFEYCGDLKAKRFYAVRVKDGHPSY